MKVREYERLKEKIEKEYKEKLRALELVWNMAKEKQSNQLIPGLATNGKKGLTACARDVLEKHTGKFDLQDVHSWVSGDHPELGEVKPPSLSNVLKRMANDGKIQIVEKGEGSRPTLYIKVGEDLNIKE